MPPHNPPQTLADAIGLMRIYQLKLFTTAMADVNSNPLTPPNPPPSDADRRDAQTKLATAQGQLQSALAQLAHLDTMDSDRAGRDAYNALTDLMKQTQVAAKDVFDKLKTVTSLSTTATPAPTTAEAQRITELVAILTQLAAISPATVWQQASSSTTA